MIPHLFPIFVLHSCATKNDNQMEINIAEDIKLCAIALEDADTIFKLLDGHRDHFQVWLPFVHYTKTVQDTKDFVQSNLDLPIDQADPTFTIRKEGKVVGLCGFRDTNYIDRHTEIGYWLSPDCQGCGIVTRAVRKLCDYAFDYLHMNRIQIRCAVGNHRSAAIPKRLGFSFEGVARQAQFYPDGSFFDLEIYSLLYTD